MKSITEIVDDIMDQMKDYGLKQGTIKMQYYGVFKPIINRHLDEGLTSYSQAIVDSFRRSYEERVSCGKVSASHMSTVRRALQFMESYHHVGVVDFSYAGHKRKLLPSDENVKLINECLKGVSTGKKEKQILDCFMRHFFLFVEHEIKPGTIITDDLVFKFIRDDCSKSSGSVGHIMRAVRELVPFLRAHGLAKGSTDFSAFTPKSPPVKLLPFYTTDEITAIIQAIDTSTTVGKRNKAMILLGYGDGFRPIDIIRLTLDDINWHTGEIRIVQSKTSVAIKLTLNPTTMNAIADYILNGRPECQSRVVFLTSQGPPRPLASSSTLAVIISDLAKKSGVEIIPMRGFYGIRRSYVINLAEADTPLTLVSQMAGHKDFSSDRRYLTFNREQTDFCAMDFTLVPVTTPLYAISVGKGGNPQ